MRTMNVLAAVLLIVGGLNWGLVGVAEFDLVATLFGPMSPVSRFVYVLVGAAAVYQAVTWRTMQRIQAVPTPARSARA